MLGTSQETTLSDQPTGAARRLQGVAIGIDGRSLSGPHTGYAMYLRSILIPLMQAGAEITLVSDRPLLLGAGLERCRHAVIGANEGPMRWEQVSLHRHLNAANYDFYLASRNCGLPLRYRGATTLLLTIHDLIPWLFPRLYFLKKPRFTFVYLTSLLIALKKARAIFTVSEASKRDLGKLAPNKPIYANWIRLSERSAPAATPPVDARYFVYVGGLDPRKNNGMLLKAFAKFRAEGGKERLVLVGRGYEPLLPLIDALDLKESVRITGYVDDDARTALLAGAVALIYPSLYEGFGLPIAEALQVGVRVLTGTGGSLPEIGGAAAEYLDPITAPSLTAALHRLAGSEPDAAFHQAARAQVNRFVSVDLDEKIVATFQELLAVRAPAAR